MKTKTTRIPSLFRMKTAETKSRLAADLKRIACGLSALVMLLFTGCNENYDPDADPTLAISPTTRNIAFGAEGKESYVYEVMTNQPVWLALSDQPWCEVVMDPQTATFTVTALPNNASTPPASATITVSAGKAGSLTITATQAAATASEPALAISPAQSTIAFSAEATEQYPFTVTTNQPSWTATSDQQWCKVAIDTKSGTFTVSALPNHAETVPATATITVTAGKATPITVTATQAAAEYDLYVSGYYTHESEGSIACYWKNNVKTDLQKPGGIQTSSVAMDIDNGSVYIAGEVDNRACYWKDGELIDLADPETEGGSMPNYPAISMAVDNGEVHVISRSYYWNGSEQPYMYATQDFEGYAIDASNGKYCIAGAMYISLGNVGYRPGLKGSGAFGLLTSGQVKDIKATCISMTDDGTYTGGHYFDMTANRMRACYWKNETFTPADAPQGITEIAVRAICVADGKVYLAGYCFTGVNVAPYYWVDGEYVALNLSGQTSEAYAEDITVINGNIYIAGSYKDAQSGRYHACYWLNGKQFDIKKEEGMLDLFATGIALVKKVSN